MEQGGGSQRHVDPQGGERGSLRGCMTNEWDISEWDGGMERKGLRVPECGRPARDGEWKTKGNAIVFCNLTQLWPRFRGSGILPHVGGT